MDIQLCENCSLCIPAEHKDWKKWLYARCRATKTAGALSLERVTSDVIPDSEKHEYCKRTEDTCSNFAALSHSIDAIDKHRRFDNEKEPSIMDMPELEEDE